VVLAVFEDITEIKGNNVRKIDLEILFGIVIVVIFLLLRIVYGKLLGCPRNKLYFVAYPPVTKFNARHHPRFPVCKLLGCPRDAQ
jgi:hypothetical protein